MSKLLSILSFIVLFLAFCFITYLNLTIAWVIIFFIVSFAYFVTIKHYLRKQIEKEFKNKDLNDKHLSRA